MRVSRFKILRLDQGSDVVGLLDNKIYKVSFNYIKDLSRDFPIDLDTFNTLRNLLNKDKHQEVLELKNEIQIHTLELFLNIVLNKFMEFEVTIRVVPYIYENGLKLTCSLSREDISAIVSTESILLHLNLLQTYLYYKSIVKFIIDLYVGEKEDTLKKLLK